MLDLPLAPSRPRIITRRDRSMSGVTDMDWHAWHDDYDEPGTPLARRLAAVQDQIRVALDAAPPGPLHAISLCAGQGRDLIGVLARHARGADVTARLVELHPRNAAAARDAAEAAGLPGVEVVTADAALTDWFAEDGFAPVWVSGPAEGWGVGAHRFTAYPVPLERGARMFRFTRRPRTLIFIPNGPGACPAALPGLALVARPAGSLRPVRHPGSDLAA